MQNKARQKQAKPAPVYKPFLPGTWRSRQCLTRGVRVFAFLVGFIFVYLFLGQVLMFDNLLLRVALNLLLLAGIAGLLYSDGAKAGIDDVAYGEIAWQQRESGRALDKDAAARSFAPAKGVCVVLVGVAPILLVSIVFAFIAQLQVYSLGGLPKWVAGLQRRADVGLALSYYHQAAPFGLEQILRIVVRLAIFPYVNMVGASSAHALLVLERMSPLLVLVAPAGYALGYLQGKRLRAGVHGAISTNAKRKVLRERQQRKRKSRQENRLV